MNEVKFIKEICNLIDEIHYNEKTLKNILSKSDNNIITIKNLESHKGDDIIKGHFLIINNALQELKNISKDLSYGIYCLQELLEEKSSFNFKMQIESHRIISTNLKG